MQFLHKNKEENNIILKTGGDGKDKKVALASFIDFSILVSAALARMVMT